MRPPTARLTIVVADSDERRTTLRSGSATVAHEPCEPGPRRGDPIGRYVVLDRIGAGGTGEVLRAYDPELDRKVAIELSHPSGDPARAHARLFAEARAPAKLHHPNIVAVHDVGLHAGRVFMAMAYVEGEDLAMWLARSRPRPEVLDAARSAARAGVLDSGSSHAQETWTLVEGRIEAYVQDWLAAHRDACVATYVRREQSAELLERINVCLDRRLHQVGVLVDLLAHADREVVDEAARASTTLPLLSECNRAALLDASGESVGPEADRIRAELDRVEVLETVAAYDEALAIARASIVDAESFPQLGLEARYRLGRRLDRTGDHDAALAELTTVHWDAEAADAARIAALAGIYVVYELAGVANRGDEALAWAPHVRASIERAGADPAARGADRERRCRASVQARIRARVGAVPRDARRARACDGRRRAAARLEPQQHRHRARGDETIRRGIAVQARALAIVTAQVGARNPHTARVHDNLGTALLRSRRAGEALEHFGTALEIRRTTFGEEHCSIAMSYVHLGLAALDADEPAQALQHYGKALAIYRKSFVEGDRQVLLAPEGLAHANAGVGDWPAARLHADIAVRGLEPLLGSDHAEILGLRDVLARAATQD